MSCSRRVHCDLRGVRSPRAVALAARRLLGVMSAFGMATLATHATQVRPTPCDEIPHGSFDAGLEGWSFQPSEMVSGEAFGVATWKLMTMNEPPYDDHVLALQTTGVSGYEGGGIGQATYKAIIHTTAVVRNELLCLQLGGGFEYVLFGNGAIDNVVRIDVVGPRGEVASHVERDDHKPGGTGCWPPGVAALGIYGPAEVPACIDLTPAGILLGDVVQIVISTEAGAATTELCQTAQSESVFLVDRVRFCPRATHPADLDGDGCVGQHDLGALLSSYGCDAIPRCPGDIDADGATDQEDLGELLAWYGYGC
jgi:hypothetical protein